ncbi:hypothetical protein [Neisseria bacilliformis]|uniref:hypothetical protein n=1 Tax=Neisseria bacilliformis TaxID=267212 RepID=UPI00128E5E08|nr:hypothetical protein [Neisseria bacilliformis]
MQTVGRIFVSDIPRGRTILWGNVGFENPTYCIFRRPLPFGCVAQAKVGWVETQHPRKPPMLGLQPNLPASNSPLCWRENRNKPHQQRGRLKAQLRYSQNRIVQLSDGLLHVFFSAAFAGRLAI